VCLLNDEYPEALPHWAGTLPFIIECFGNAWDKLQKMEDTTRNILAGFLSIGFLVLIGWIIWEVFPEIMDKFAKKVCPHCQSKIPEKASVCKHCTKDV